MRDILLTNAHIVTSDAARPRADTLAIRGGRIAFVGERADWDESLSLPERNLGGRTVVPGLIDAHTHPSMVARSAWHVPLPKSDDVDEILAFVRGYGAAHPREEAPFLYFEYYPSTLFGDGRPTKELLDTAISDRPVLLQDFSDHAHWVNSRMIDLLGVTADTPDPVPGLEMFVRDDDGRPTGHILEMAYTHFIDRLYDRIGWRPPAVTTESLADVLDTMGASGVTALFEALIEDEDALEAVSGLDRSGRLHLRYEAAARFRTRADLPGAIARARRWDERYGSDRVRIRTLKLFLDGTNESGNSAVIAPFDNDASRTDLGDIQMETDELVECLELMNHERIDLHIHMVGDRAFRVACDAVERAQTRSEINGAPWLLQVTFAHCELIDPADMGRPAALGVIVNWTTHWSGGYFGEEGRAYLGDRWDHMYDFTAIADSGATLAFASDVVTRYELHRAHPFFGMQVAATRVDPEVPLDPGRYPGSVRPSARSRLSVERLLKGHTIDAARQLRIDAQVGSLEVGKDANLVVLSDDPFEIDVDRLGTIRPVAVMVEGEVVSGEL
ncbi:N-substituted formamide deformylase [Microbacterium lemovicicum]|uniref:N-substituted formamide deformylase n=1 Tax=Microbacterium lemovicicum TaxID=1072463 RepID=A0A3Q9J0A2_9MICO|nr:amidohydrolase family protein [Microbacterium lemovicicum]AZS37505.1 N-substituted formamide deformylase [Microbacterium lemovicicum]